VSIIVSMSDKRATGPAVSVRSGPAGTTQSRSFFASLN
jgi:hypothetical protein